MGFRTVEISRACEIHIKEGQLEISSDEGTVLIPIEDLNQIMVHGANIRLSTMDLSILSQNKVSVMTLDEKYLPTAIVLPYEGHARQSKLMHMQVAMHDEIYIDLWTQIIKQKISNQSRALSIMDMDGSEVVDRYVDNVTIDNVDIMEALAAKEYFSYYHEGLNRRSDDLIEPYRAIVDVVVHENIGSNVKLSKSERRAMAYVLHNACMMDGMKINVMSAINMMVESLKRIILDKSKEKLQLSLILPIESMEGITE